MSGSGAITVVFVALQTSNQANGGIESFAQIVERLEGVSRIVVTDRRSKAVDRLEARGCEVIVLDAWAPLPLANAGRVASFATRARRIPAMAKVNARIAGIVRRSGAKVVHCNDISALWHAALGARSAGARVVFNVRDMFPTERAYGLKWRAARQLASEFLVLSEEMRSEIDARVRPPLAKVPGVARSAAPTVAIRSIVDLDRMRPLAPGERAAARLQLGIEPNALAISQIGSFCPKKGQLDLLLKVAPAVLEAVPSAVFRFFGDLRPESDPYARACVEALASLPTHLRNRIAIEGFSERIERIYQASDIVVLPSAYEGLARAMIESVACGTPVVSFDVTSADEVLAAGPGRSTGAGLVVARGDFEGLAGALIRLANDSAMRREMATCGREVAVELFSPERQVVRHAELYQRLHSGLRPS